MKSNQNIFFSNAISHMLIGICSQLQMGKDTLAEIIIDFLQKSQNISLVKYSFANNLKNIICDAFDMTKDELETKKISGEKHNTMLVNVRTSLQTVGEAFRTLDPNVWIRLCMRDKPKHCVLTDVRYENEMKAVKENNGILILLSRLSRISDSSHPSESFMREPIEWFEANTPAECQVVCVHDLQNVPLKFQMFNYFVRNNTSLDDLKAVCDHLEFTQ
jgi:hypothetical protein